MRRKWGKAKKKNKEENSMQKFSLKIKKKKNHKRGDKNNSFN